MSIKKNLSKSDILEKYSGKVFLQDYSQSPKIEGVAFYDIKNFTSDDGSFCELGRINAKGELEAIPGFKVEQISYALMVPGSIKAWHIHFNQEDVWYVPSEDRLLVGLIDLRKNSPTKDIKMRFSMGGGKSQLLYIPRGVAHGLANMGTNNAREIYFTNQKFDAKNPDERRLAWDTFGADFWKFKYG